MHWSNQLSKLWYKAMGTGNHTELEAYAQRLDEMNTHKPNERLQSLSEEARKMSVSIKRWNTEQIVEDEAPGLITSALSYLSRR